MIELPLSPQLCKNQMLAKMFAYTDYQHFASLDVRVVATVDLCLELEHALVLETLNSDKAFSQTPYRPHPFWWVDTTAQQHLREHGWGC